MAHLTDQELISHYLNNDNHRSFEQLYHRYHRMVYQHCLLMCRDTDEADDLTQDVFIRLTRNLGSYKGEARFGTWLHRVTHNYCIDQLRKQQNLRIQHEQYSVALSGGNDEPEPPFERVFAVLDQALNRLPPQQQVLLRTKYEQGIEIKDIARQQQLTPSAAKMRLKRARDQARKLYLKLASRADTD